VIRVGFGPFGLKSGVLKEWSLYMKRSQIKIIIIGHLNPVPAASATIELVSICWMRVVWWLAALWLSAV
jgi:hypothetical protein